MTFWLAVVLPLVLALQPPQDVESGPPTPIAARVEDGSGVSHEGRLAAWDAEGLVVQTPDGRRTVADPVHLAFRATGTTPAPARDVVLLSAAGTRPPDRLCGRLEAGDEFGLTLAIEGVPVELPFDVIDRLLPYVDRPLDRLAELTASGLDDRVWRRREDGGLDGVVGVVARVGEGRVVLQSGLGDLPFDLVDVLAVVLADGGASPDEDASPCARGDVLARVRVALAGGSLFSAGLLGMDEHGVRLCTPFAAELRLPLAAVHGLCVESEDRLLLADLAPVEVEERPSLGDADDVLFPWRRDLSVSGVPLRVDGTHRATGVGVHAFTRLAYDVPAGARSLRVRAGICDEAADLPASASVRCEIRVDGRVAARSGVLREGDASVVLNVPDLTGAQRVELVVDDGDDLDAADRAAWVDGWFVVTP